MALGPGPKDPTWNCPPTLLLWPLLPRSPKVTGAGPLQGPCSIPSPTPSLVCSATASMPFTTCVQVRPPPDQGPHCPWDPVESPPWPQPWGPRPGPLRASPPAPAPRGRALDFYRPCSCLGSPPPGLSTASCHLRLVQPHFLGPGCQPPLCPTRALLSAWPRSPHTALSRCACLLPLSAC